MEEGDKGCLMIRMGVSGWMFLMVPAYPGCPGSKAVKRSLLLLFYQMRQTTREFTVAAALRMGITEKLKGRMLCSTIIHDWLLIKIICNILQHYCCGMWNYSALFIWWWIWRHISVWIWVMASLADIICGVWFWLGDIFLVLVTLTDKDNL